MTRKTEIRAEQAIVKHELQSRDIISFAVVYCSESDCDGALLTGLQEPVAYAMVSVRIGVSGIVHHSIRGATN